jgi:amidase
LLPVELDAELKSGKSRGSLHGIPVLSKITSIQQIKCNYSWSLSFSGYERKTDAHVVKRLRNAGAIILGKQI